MPTLQATSLPSHILSLPLSGRNLRPGPLGAQLEAEPTLLVFLRHFG